MKDNFVAGEWIKAATAKPNSNPSDVNDIIDEFAQAGAADVETAVAAAKAALPAWSRQGPQLRSDLLDKVGSELIARREELGELLSREQGKIRADGVGEVVRAGNVFKFFAAEALRMAGDRIASTRPGIDIEVIREPVGVIGIITPWNFPMAIPAWKIAPALAFGNCVLFKPAELVPASAWALADIIARAGFPAGVFNLLMGRGSVLGDSLVDGVDAITFTGSVPTGRAIARRAIEHMARIQLEMGGKSPLVVLNDAHLDTAVDCALNGSFFATGQRCTASSRLVVEDGIHDRFVAALIERMRSCTIGHALDPDSHIGPVVDESQLEQDLSYIRIGESDGGKRAFGGEKLRRATDGFFLQPCLFTDTTNAMRINREEIFGPVASVIRVKDYEEALAVANDSEFGLSSSICTSSLKYSSHFRSHSAAGLAMVNLPTSGIDHHVPFGGRKASSYGPREQGRSAIEFYTSTKTSYIRSDCGD